MKFLKQLMFFFTLIGIYGHTYSQDQRYSDNNSIGWLAYTGTLKIHPKIALHTEYQWRRLDGLKNLQQHLLRTGVNYALIKDVSLNVGYAFAETSPYGKYASEPNIESLL